MSSKRLLFLCLFALANIALGTPNRFNVLFIAVDDLRPELGCYGVEDAQSPNIDRFAETAFRFDRHYVQCATCGASRYALLTGKSPASSGVTGGNHGFYQGDSALSHKLQAGAQSLPEQFRRSGYRTVCLGKLSHTADGRVYAYDGKGDGRDEVPHAWDSLATPFGSWGRGWGIFFAYPKGKHREDGDGHIDLMDFTAEKDNELPDGMLADKAIAQLHELKARQQPFFLGLGFIKPHLPFVAPKQDWDAFEEVELAETPFPDKVSSPHWHRSGEFYKYAMPFEKTHPLSEEDRRTARRAYLACVRYTDRQVGKVLESLDKLGLAENTIVVLWGDHGWHLGEQAIWAKHAPFELSMRSPLMMRVPGVSVLGGRSSALVESVDIYPTLVSLCQPRFLARAHRLDGKDLSGILSGTTGRVRQTAISYWRKAVSIRTDTHRLVIQGEERELYDLRQDLANDINSAGSDSPTVESILQLAGPRLSR